MLHKQTEYIEAGSKVHQKPLAGGGSSYMLPRQVTDLRLACSPTEEAVDKEKPSQRRADHWDFERAPGWAGR